MGTADNGQPSWRHDPFKLCSVHHLVSKVAQIHVRSVGLIHEQDGMGALRLACEVSARMQSHGRAIASKRQQASYLLRVARRKGEFSVG